MSWLRRWRKPVPPENVRVVLRDGTVIGPVPLRYDGYDNGAHVWVALLDKSLATQVERATVGVLPGYTALMLAFLPSKALAETLENQR